MKSPILISWMAWANDFIRPENSVNPQGPTLMAHEYLYDKNKYERHILLSTEREDGLSTILLFTEITKRFPKHKVEIQYMDIKDPIDFERIYTLVYQLLSQYQSKHTLDVFFSPGTSIMQLAWAMCLQSGIKDMRLIQGRRARDTTSGRQEFTLLDINFNIQSHPIQILTLDLVSGRPPYEDETDIYHPPFLDEVYIKANKLAQTIHPVGGLLLGETGTGKEQLAKYIHENSQRRSKPFIAVNCGAMSNELLHSELFGHEKGAFTGATEVRKGMFEAAHGGTLFLDEIGDVSSDMQKALLRVLQESKIRKLGSNEEITVDVRVLAATHKNLENEIIKGNFREDLFYRLSLVELNLPPLRMWPEKNKIELIHFILNKLTKQYELDKLPSISKPALSQLLKYRYPGNIRELRFILERMIIYEYNPIKPEHLPERINQRIQETMVSYELEAAIRKHIKFVLSECQDNKEQARKHLGISYNTLIKYIS